MHCSTVHWAHLHTEALSSLLENCVRRKSNTAEISHCCQWWRLRELGILFCKVSHVKHPSDGIIVWWLREFLECLACHYQWGFNELFVGCAGMSAVYQSMLSQSVYITYIYMYMRQTIHIFPRGLFLVVLHSAFLFMQSMPGITDTFTGITDTFTPMSYWVLCTV